jgi:exonuclease-1
MLQFDGQYRVPPGYLEAFRQAELTFLHQRVFCPLANALVLNTDLDDNIKEDDLPFIGSHTEPDVAMAVAGRSSSHE